MGRGGRGGWVGWNASGEEGWVGWNAKGGGFGGGVGVGYNATAAERLRSIKVLLFFWRAWAGLGGSLAGGYAGLSGRFNNK